ncbi:PaaI family thioesterase [Pararhodobacter sp. SW119]|uniref:PaaI family thioesterase n=1 Tax=Pararhodobacter sp. SW119 TaxID=2780075 RepID=UPI001ADFAB93|nr:PaaI family thioesterase [Pararhodobacter sp. SW119]
MTPQMDCNALNAFMMAEFPQVASDFQVERVASMEADVRLLAHEKHLRPGGTVSGPAMFALADLAMYAVLLAMIGPKGLSVTTSCSIDFMRKPAAGRDMIARARLLKLGRVLAVGDALLFSEGEDQPAARASLTYSIPPR